MLTNQLRIGFIQTVVEENIAWDISKKPIRMSHHSEERAWYEIKKGFIDLLNGYEKPQIILIPELSVPIGYEYELRKLCASSGAVVIAGLDFYWRRDQVCNLATVIVPGNWPEERSSKSTSYFYFGKTFYSRDEEEIFKGCELLSQPEIFILNASEFGNIGVAICSDFFDVERFVVYKGRIHHLVIIAHNKDTESYYFLAEAISRLVFCNVVICNTGEYGDSIGFSPYKEAFQRMLYRHKGAGLFSTQVINLPVSSLDKEQRGLVKTKEKIFKATPPGYTKY
jgi:hypothetical protein